MIKNVISFIKTYKSDKSNKLSHLEKQNEQAKVYKESKILIKSDAGKFAKNSLTIVIPKTEYASKWWGQGTQWCKSIGIMNRSFNYYNKDGPLIIIIINGIKIQLHVNLSNRHSTYFVDEYNNQVNFNFFKDNWKILSPVMEWAVRHNGLALWNIPESLRTLELCLEAVIQNGEALSYVPKTLKTTKLCLEAVKSNGLALWHVPESLRTAEICQEAMDENIFALRYVPKDLITLKLCQGLVRQNGRILECVPRKLKTMDICLEAVRQNGCALEYVSQELRTPEIYLEAVRQNSATLRYVPQNLRTAEILLEVSKKIKIKKSNFNHYEVDDLDYESSEVNKSSILKPSWDFNIFEGFKLELENTFD